MVWFLYAARHGHHRTAIAPRDRERKGSVIDLPNPLIKTITKWFSKKQQRESRKQEKRDAKERQRQSLRKARGTVHLVRTV